MGFSSLNLSQPILSALEEKGYLQPSPIQQQAIPAILSGKDVMAAAQTGTGKTAGFTLPILELLSTGERAKANQARVLILTPTRELAAQIGDNVKQYSKNLPLRSTVVFGGVKINPQMIALRKGVDILVATPGRLLDLFQQNAVKFKQLEMLVLDEADRMLDMGFIHDIKKILALLPAKRQNLLFSATFSDDIRALAKNLVSNPVEISVAPANSTAKTVEQWIYPTDKNKKSSLLTSLIHNHRWQQVLVFSRTKHGANRLAKHLEKKKITASAIHGNKSQGARTKALAEFKSGKVRVLVATDIAARGLDIDQLPHVINYDLPHVAEDYVHRIGRTGRAGADGQALSLVCEDEIKQLNDIEQLIQQHLERRIEPGFNPVNELPASRPIRPPKNSKPKKPKKPKTEHKDGQRSGDNASGHQPVKKEEGSKPARRWKGKPKSNAPKSNNSGSGSGRSNKPNPGNRSRNNSGKN